MTRTLADLGLLALKQENYPAARRWLEESLSNQKKVGKGGAIIYSLLLLGELSMREGKFAEAQAYYKRSLAVAEKAGISPWAPLKWIPVHLGYIALRQGNLEDAKKHFEESHKAFKGTGITIGTIYTIEGQASLAVLQGQPAHAARLFAWADSARETLGNSRPPVEQISVEKDIAAIRAQLDETAFNVAQIAGRVMNMDEAVAYTKG
jgi:tetratricopeptide (TPR) repeat protein